MHHIVLWKWKQPGYRERFTAEHVNVMNSMVLRNLAKTQVRVHCVTDEQWGVDGSIKIHPIWNDITRPNICGQHLPSCYRRIRLFDPVTQSKMGINPGDRIVSIDLDTVIMAKFDDLLARKDRFLGWAVRGSKHPTVFNGSFWMFTAGDLEEVWTEFDVNTSPDAANRAGYLGSDQAWLSYKLVKKEGSGGLTFPNILSYPREIFNRRPRYLPNGCKIVFFHGKKKPWHPQVQKEALWIPQHWRL